MACQVVCAQLHRTQTKGTEESPEGGKMRGSNFGRVKVPCSSVYPFLFDNGMNCIVPPPSHLLFVVCLQTDLVSSVTFFHFSHNDFYQFSGVIFPLTEFASVYVQSTGQSMNLCISERWVPCPRSSALAIGTGSPPGSGRRTS